MKISSFIVVAAAAVAAGIGALHLFDTLRVRESSAARPASAAPARPPAVPPVLEAPDSTAASDLDAAVPDAPEPADRPRQLALEVERALVASDPQQRETAFNVLLPELLAGDPGSVVAMVSRQPPGEARDALREEVTRQWITRDREAAIAWLDTLEESERKASAVTATAALAAGSPALAIEVADHFGVGRDDGSLEHLVQRWATEDPDAATRWLETQPEGPATDQLRARIEQARAAAEGQP